MIGLVVSGSLGRVSGRALDADCRRVAASGAAASAACVMAVVALSLPASAQQTDSALSVELNKLESYDKGCRAYVVVNNPGAVAYQSVKLDLVLFQPDGVVGKRLAVDLAPLKPAKKTVKLFEVDGVACERVASVLVNDVMECKADGNAVPDCLGKIVFSSLATAPLTTK